MTREQIEKEIDVRLEEPDNEWDGIFNSGYSRGFRDGAQWRINSVWHDASEEPEQEDEPILVEYEDWGIEGSDYTVCDDIWDYRTRLKRDGAGCTILRWAYMKDLIPERKEETNGGR